MRHVCVVRRPRAVAGFAITTGHGVDRRLGARVVSSSGGEEQASSSRMTGAAGVMDLVVAGAKRDAGGIAGGACMAAYAGGRGG